MSQKTYSVTLGTTGGDTREVRVTSPTDVQAGDAARPLMSQGESILEIRETHDDAPIDSGPPVSQAAELAPVTPGFASAPEPGQSRGSNNG